MNDENREKLSAYLDGALSDQERKAVEVEISRSEDMRLELEALRAVSAAVKGLPKEKLPAGFMARFEARRAREISKPERDYLILPPSYRPLAFALSTAVVALVVWDRTQTPEFAPSSVGWDGAKIANVKSAAEAPPSIDVSERLSAMNARSLSGAASEIVASGPSAQSAAKEDSFGDKIGALSSIGGGAGVASTFGKHLNAPGKPIEIREDRVPAAPAVAAPAAALDELAPADGALIARNEEERSAINEHLYKNFEEEKKRMGIARILEKDADDDRKQLSGGREMMTLQATPEAAKVARRRGSVSAVRGAAALKAKGEAVVQEFKAIALKSPEALQAAWAAAGLPGEAPEVAFPGQMAVFLAGPAGCGITGVQDRKKFLVVLYKDAGFDDPAARVRAVPLSPKPVVVKLAQ